MGLKIKILTKSIAKNRSTIVKFLSIGGVATLTHASVYYILIELMHLMPQLANLIGFIVAFSVSYVGQRRWVFGHVIVNNEFIAKLKFCISSLVSLAINALWVEVTIQVFGLSPEYSIIGIVFITPIIIFLILKLWVFTHNANSKKAS